MNINDALQARQEEFEKLLYGHRHLKIHFDWKQQIIVDLNKHVATQEELSQIQNVKFKAKKEKMRQEFQDD